MSNNKQTAVEWLENQILAHKRMFGVLPTEKGLINLIEQSKEMEKQQIINGRITAPITTGDIELDRQEAEHYYNQEYRGETLNTTNNNNSETTI